MTEHPFYNSLALLANGNYSLLKRLWKKHRSWQKAYESLPKIEQIPVDKAWMQLERHGITLLLISDSAFPPLLREIPHPPFGLYYRGGAISEQLKLAIIGTRKATKLGVEIANTFASELASAGLEIVSGLAFGIDAASHHGALSAKGKALAVLASGCEQITPYSNQRLGDAILSSGGTILSEYPIGTSVVAEHFLSRNRIVSGLSQGVLVIEAPKRSGTLATSRFAIEQNREVFVIPGSITNANYEGSHALIQSGAMLVTSPLDILRALGLANEEEDVTTSHIHTALLTKEQKVILDLLASNAKPLHTDEIIAAVDLPEAVVHEALTLLSISNIIKEENGRYYR